MKQIISNDNRPSGISFAADYRYYYPKDIVCIRQPRQFLSDIGSNIYRFGYQFTPSATNEQRADFISYINGHTDSKISDSELLQFINFPLKALNDSIGLVNFDGFVYPGPRRDPLQSRMISAINRYLGAETNKVSFAFVKQVPTNIQFDWELFKADHFSGIHPDSRYDQMCEYVATEILPKLQELDYSFIAKDMKTEYRKYLRCIQGLNTFEEIEKFSKLKGSRILIVDGSARDEITGILKRVNPKCEIFIYTLIASEGYV